MLFGNFGETHFTVMCHALQPLFSNPPRTRSFYPNRSSTYLRAAFFSLLVLSLLPGVSQASNLWKEQEIARDIKNVVNEKEMIWLDIGKRQPSLALYLPSKQIEVRGGLILLHDFGHHPNWPRVINPLRQILTDDGWHTLSVQTPIPDELWNFTQPADIYKETGERITAATQWLKQRGIANIVILAQGKAAALAARFASENSDNYRAVVVVSLENDESQSDWRNSITSLEQLFLPVLDIFAEFDERTVNKYAPHRVIAARQAGERQKSSPPIPHSQRVRELAQNKTNNLWYRQIEIKTAHIGFPKTTAQLTKQIRGWLRHYARSP